MSRNGSGSHPPKPSSAGSSHKHGAVRQQRRPTRRHSPHPTPHGTATDHGPSNRTAYVYWKGSLHQHASGAGRTHTHAGGGAPMNSTQEMRASPMNGTKSTSLNASRMVRLCSHSTAAGHSTEGNVSRIAPATRGAGLGRRHIHRDKVASGSCRDSAVAATRHKTPWHHPTNAQTAPTQLSHACHTRIHIHASHTQAPARAHTQPHNACPSTDHGGGKFLLHSHQWWVRPTRPTPRPRTLTPVSLLASPLARGRAWSMQAE
jgi:hypothetical protein